MSGSPKYNCYQLQREQERRLREERKARAREEAERRRQEQAARRLARLLIAREAVEGDLAAAERRLADIPDAVLRHGGAALAEAPALLRGFREALQRCSWEGEAWELRDKLRAARVELGRRIDEARHGFARAEAQRLRDERERERARLEGEICWIEERLRELGAEDRRRFDAAGGAAVETALAAARRAHRSGDFTAAAAALEEAASLVGEHERRVERERAVWQAAYNAAQARLAAADEALAGLMADEVVLRWCRPRVVEWQAACERMKDALATGRFAEVESLAGSLLPTTDAVLAEAQERQLREDQRQYVVQSLCEVLAGQGFILRDGSPALDYPDHPASATMIHACRITGEALAISVPQDLREQIEYDADGYARREQPSPAGAVSLSCDDAENAIDDIRAVLEERFGIESTPLEWEGKDPLRVRKGSKDLPGGQSRAAADAAS